MTELKDQALRKIGRNVVNLQKIEGMLKLLLSRSNFKCPINKLEETLEERKEKFEKMTLGQIDKEYFKIFNTCVEHIHQYPEEINKPWISFSFDSKTEAGNLLKQKAAFKFMVSERNRLIHQMLINFNPDSTESCNALILELDEQNEMIKPEYSNLQAKIQSLDEVIKLFFWNQVNQRGQRY